MDPHFPRLDSVEQCQNRDECEICKDSNLCNAQTVADTCIKCSSSAPLSSCVAAPCSLKRNFAQSNGCYLNFINDTTYERGCMRDLDSTEQKLCQQQNGNCRSCKYPNCNRKESFKTACFECNGEVDPTCIDSASRSASQVDCSDYTKTCAIGIDKNGFTQRGCISYNLLNSLFPRGLYKICPQHLCNHEVFPTNRPRCFHIAISDLQLRMNVY